MQRIDRIIQHATFVGQIKRLEQLEKDRRFCRHGWSHLLDVARIAWILCKERSFDFSKEVIYATALLHDIGRVREYEELIPHEDAACSCVAGILEECGFTKEERSLILAAIALHNERTRCQDNQLAALLYEADKCSRLCFTCVARSECKWSEEEKNRTIKY